MDDSAFLVVLRPYFEAISEVDTFRRLELLEQAMSPEAQIWGPKRVFAGYGETSEKTPGFHKNWPGCRLVLATGLNIFQTAARFGSAIIHLEGMADDNYLTGQASGN